MNRVNEIIRLKALADRIIPVGVGSTVSEAYLTGLAKNMPVQSNGNNFLSAEYANLGSITGVITDAACPISPPTQAPTKLPTSFPTASPSSAPTAEPSAAPTADPTSAPTFDCAACTSAQVATCDMGAGRPGVCGFTSAACDTAKCGCAGGFTCSGTNCAQCTAAPTLAPTGFPTAAPSVHPTAEPSFAPTAAPSTMPTIAPSAPTNAPTYWDLFQSGQEDPGDAKATTAAGVAGAAIGTLFIILAVIAAIAAIILVVALTTGVGIFAHKKRMVNISTHAFEGEIHHEESMPVGTEIEAPGWVSPQVEMTQNAATGFHEVGYKNPMAAPAKAGV